ncbi:MAG: glycerol-3-phosphate dehydrogenase/oxidase [Candidatus Nanopelagicales bacterium]|nr:glycerol-3-phosphate dehydrogenase/oxidase [Candidatus Nanopelagicales bacterium]MDZ4249546.1 glycerol-3-phosphate dehydrogenase/oxidase [Candidatus Nanopelagicales bacterium]
MTARPRLIPPGDPATRLNADRRAKDRDDLAGGEAVDVLVVGGGITGTGVALDAASRGLSVALVESHDLAHGTSRWSSKLVHGGLRYLAKGDIGVAWESAQERSIIASRVAPHLIHSIPQVVPVYSGNEAKALLARMGFAAGDAMRVAARTPRGLLPSGRIVTRGLAQRLVPTIRTEGLRGAIVGWDCQLEDDARLVVAIARTAAKFGARILTRMRAVEVSDTGAIVEDTRDSGQFGINARTVVNATGVWAGQLDPSIELRPSLGSHIVVRSKTLGNPAGALTVEVPGHFGRYVFVLPQRDGLCYIGLTDNPVEGGIPDVPVAPSSDIDWIIGIISSALERPLTSDDVVGSFAGVRPLVVAQDGAPKGSSADISRRHVVRRSGSMITVTGGKLTTYRKMASDVVDQIADSPCLTAGISLVGAGPKVEGSSIPARLWRRYGNEAPRVWAIGSKSPSLREPVADSVAVLGVEFAFGREYELALTVDDLIHRRTRLGLVPADAAAAVEAAELAMRD